jgi:hypothetical protein
MPTSLAVQAFMAPLVIWMRLSLLLCLSGAVREDCFAMSDKQRVSRITLSVDCLSLAEEHHRPTRADDCKKGSRVGNAYLVGHWADDYSAELTLKHTNQ